MYGKCRRFKAVKDFCSEAASVSSGGSVGLF